MYTTNSLVAYWLHLAAVGCAVVYANISIK